MRTSKVFVAVLTPRYFQRKWCMLELDIALNDAPRGRTLIPVLLGVGHDYAELHNVDRYRKAWRDELQASPETT